MILVGFYRIWCDLCWIWLDLLGFQTFFLFFLGSGLELSSGRDFSYFPWKVGAPGDPPAHFRRGAPGNGLGGIPGVERREQL